jgi:hypothetical protein
MKLMDHLSDDNKKKLNEISKKKRRRKRKGKNNPLRQTERLTERDYKELMGQYKETYKRGKGGAMRRS